MRYSAYDKYQSSRFEKNLNIPTDWQEKRLKFIASHNNETLSEKTDPDYEIEYVDISSIDLVNGITKTETLTFEKAPSRARRIVKDGDSIVSTVRTYLKAIATIRKPPENMVVSTGFAVIRPKDAICKNYLSYFLQSQGFVDSVVAHSVGVSYPAINASDLVCLPVSFPVCVNEQQKIADFLDYKTQQIDRLIEKKKALIEKLNEQRIAVITQAVTKGLDKTAPMKPSGVEWLGDVPAHWQIMQFKDRCRVVSGQVEPTLPEYEDLPLIAPDHIEKGSGRLLETQTAKEQGAISGKYLFEKGDLLYSKIRPELNKLCIAPSQGLCSADMYAIRTENDLLIEFVYYLMLSKYFHQYAVLESMRVAMPKINRDALGQFKILVPPFNEQVEIVIVLRSVLENIRSNIDISNRSISILEEYRTALITAAVTGKIDVRNVEIPGQETA